jgi:haloacetate dehalogenase
MMNRRDAIKQGAIAAAGTLVAGGAGAQEGGEARFFPGSKPFKAKTTGAEINGVIGGRSAHLLLHGAPQSHITWRLVAPAGGLAHWSSPDLRGYGDSGKPLDGRTTQLLEGAMALDQVGMNTSATPLPADRPDRGGRVTHRPLDHPEKVSHAAVLDIVPTRYLYTHFSIEFAQAYPHMLSTGAFNALLKTLEEPPLHVKLILATTDVQKEYLRSMTDMATIHAMCEDYRASASIDLKWDELDARKKITIPLRVLWAEKGPMGRLDVPRDLEELRHQGDRTAATGGHNLQEDVPDMVLEEIHGLLKL